MGTFTIRDYLLKDADKHLLVCPLCHSKRFNVVVIKRAKKEYATELRCDSATCKKRVAYDVTNGFVTRE